jgi:hypothetical protein
MPVQGRQFARPSECKEERRATATLSCRPPSIWAGGPSFRFRDLLSSHTTGGALKHKRALKRLF